MKNSAIELAVGRYPVLVLYLIVSSRLAWTVLKLDVSKRFFVALKREAIMCHHRSHSLFVWLCAGITRCLPQGSEREGGIQAD